MNKSILIKDVAPQEHAVLVRAAKRHKMSLQKYLIEQVHLIAQAEENRAVLEEMEAGLPSAGSMTGAELDELRDASHAQYTENIARKSDVAP